jgi:hypothetical protein
MPRSETEVQDGEKLKLFACLPACLSIRLLSDGLSICMFVCLSVQSCVVWLSVQLCVVCLSVHPSVVWRSVYLPVRLSVCQSIWLLSACLFIHMYVCLSVCPSISASLHLSVCPSVCLYSYLYVCPSIRLSFHKPASWFFASWNFLRVCQRLGQQQRPGGLMNTNPWLISTHFQRKTNFPIMKTKEPFTRTTKRVRFLSTGAFLNLRKQLET